MSLIAVNPGTFDPITNGHTDLVNRGVKIFDKVIIAVAQNPSKNTLFNVKERIEFIQEIFDANSQVEIYSLDKLLVDFANDHNATVILRGLRAVSDFEYGHDALTSKIFRRTFYYIWVFYCRGIYRNLVSSCS